MTARGIAAAFVCGAVFVLALAVRAVALAMVATWSEALTVAVVVFAGVAVIVIALGVASGVRLALSDRRENARPIIVSPPSPPAFAAPDALRDAERMARVQAIIGAGAGGRLRVPAFDAGPWVDDASDI